ncbi:hypothetical protein Vadar_032525 [Vaccinium darrowii]|uniref:Uncharacterized protein n=1 Tax=Vaccinium darrowii TaxID=229202 RepID=A0ACB7XLV6_9ERIC|nr:hypothetical protein Vadar_032525 [Vaccinium darrowii]
MVEFVHVALLTPAAVLLVCCRAYKLCCTSPLQRRFNSKTPYSQYLKCTPSTKLHLLACRQRRVGTDLLVAKPLVGKVVKYCCNVELWAVDTSESSYFPRVIHHLCLRGNGQGFGSRCRRRGRDGRRKERVRRWKEKRNIYNFFWRSSSAVVAVVVRDTLLPRIWKARWSEEEKVCAWLHRQPGPLFLNLVIVKKGKNELPGLTDSD